MSRVFGRPPGGDDAEADAFGLPPRREVRVGEKIIPDERASEDVRPPAEEPEPVVDAADASAADREDDGTSEVVDATVADPEPAVEPQPAAEPEPEPEPEPESESDSELEPPAAALEHAPGELRIPDGVGVFVGSPNGSRRSVGIAVSSFNGDITTRLLEGALDALAEAGVDRARVDVMRVPGAFELPLAAMALAKTRRYACVLALGCIIRGDTPHFEYIAAEAASGLQLASLETGVPVSFGVLTCDSRMQAEARAGGRHGNKGAEAARSGLEMADVFARLRADAVVADRR